MASLATSSTIATSTGEQDATQKTGATGEQTATRKRLEQAAAQASGATAASQQCGAAQGNRPAAKPRPVPDSQKGGKGKSWSKGDWGGRGKGKGKGKMYSKGKDKRVGWGKGKSRAWPDQQVQYREAEQWADDEEEPSGLVVEPTPKKVAKGKAKSSGKEEGKIARPGKQQEPKPPGKPDKQQEARLPAGKKVFSALAHFMQQMQDVAEQEDWDPETWEYTAKAEVPGAGKTDAEEEDGGQPEDEPDWGGSQSKETYSSSESSYESVEISEDEM